MRAPSEVNPAGKHVYSPKTIGVPAIILRSLEEAEALFEETVGPNTSRIIKEFDVRTREDHEVETILFGRPHQLRLMSSISLEVTSGDSRVYNEVLQACSGAYFVGVGPRETLIHTPGNIRLRLHAKPSKPCPKTHYSSAGFELSPAVESALNSGVIHVNRADWYSVERYLSYGLRVETDEAYDYRGSYAYIPDSPWNAYGCKMPDLEGPPHHYSEEIAERIYLEMLGASAPHTARVSRRWQDYLLPVSD